MPIERGSGLHRGPMEALRVAPAAGNLVWRRTGGGNPRRESSGCAAASWSYARFPRRLGPANGRDSTSQRPRWNRVLRRLLFWRGGRQPRLPMAAPKFLSTVGAIALEGCGGGELFDTCGHREGRSRVQLVGICTRVPASSLSSI
jgi:hypothetical protein